MVLESRIYVYNFADLRLVDHIETIKNPKGARTPPARAEFALAPAQPPPPPLAAGLCAVCPSSTNTVLACPGLQRGSVRVELYDTRKSTFISAHESDLAAIALNASGTRVATAGEKVRALALALAMCAGARRDAHLRAAMPSSAGVGGGVRRAR